MKDNRDTITTPEGFEAYVKKAGNFRPIDDKLNVEIMRALEKDFPQTFGRIADYRPPTKVVLPIKSGIVQDAYLKDAILPEFVGGPLEQASYPILQKERFYADDSTIALNAKAKRSDVTISWGQVTVKAHAREAASERREQAAASFGAGMDILAYKADVITEQLAVEEEVAVAAFLSTAGNFTTVKSVGAGEYWNDYSTPSDPVSMIFDYKETLRTTARLTGTMMQDLLFVMGNSVFEKLRRHPKVVAISSVALFGAGKGSLDLPVDEAFLAALFGMNIAVGRAGYSPKLGGAVTDIWGKTAAIVYTGGGAPIAPRFGFNVTSEGYPSSLEYFDPSVGTKGADVVKVSDAWNPTAINKDSGVLFTTAIQ
jgi:hypothetical protein